MAVSEKVIRARAKRAYQHFSITLLVCCLAALVLPLTAAGQANGRQTLHGHIPNGIAGLKPLGQLSGQTNLQLAIGLPLHNTLELNNLLQQIYDPHNPNYRHFLTPEQFTERFGPTKQEYQAVVNFAKANGLKVTTTHPNRLILDVSGTTATVEKAFQISMQVYQHPTEARKFYAPDTEPSVSSSLPINYISGLDNFSLPKPRLHATPIPVAQSRSVTPNAGAGPSGTFTGKDFRAAYVPDTTMTGSGQVVGLLQFDGYTASDITYYESYNGLPNVPLQNVLIDGATGNPSHGGGEVEVSLDIEMSISMAPGLSKVMVYMSSGSWVNMLNRMVTDNQAKQISCSWYIPNGSANPNTDVIFQEMAAQGQTFFTASGDSDAFTGLIPFPGDTPYITVVGGTTLTTTGPAGARVSENTWNRNNGIGTGGGISTQYSIPSWQTNINMTPPQGSTTKRNVPDVALTADNVYVRADGEDYYVGGTSCAAPLWAGFMSLVNQQAVASGNSTVGFLNPTVYALGGSANYSSCFHDITTGNNTSANSPTHFYAV